MLLLAGLVMAASWMLAARLEVRPELRELLPRDSVAYRNYESQSKRMVGGSNLVVIVSSPDRHANERFVATLGARLDEQAHGDGAGANSEAASLIEYVEWNVRDVLEFYRRNRYLFASIQELNSAEEQLDLALAKRMKLVEDFDDETPGAAQSSDGTSPSLDESIAQLTAGLSNPWGITGEYFTTRDGSMAGLKIVSRQLALGDRRERLLVQYVEREADSVLRSLAVAGMTYGLAGDIPQGLAEQQSIISEALWVTLFAAALILGGVVWYFRSLWSLVTIGLPAFLGVGIGYAFAALTYGYVNTIGAFLGAIIVGNGINYPIVLLSRYRDFRRQGWSAEIARRKAVLNAFRAELVGASVAAIAYGSLLVTDFRGYAQFGAIGVVGMLSVWLAIVPLVPAMLVLEERHRVRKQRSLFDAPAAEVTLGPPQITGNRFVGRLTDLTTAYPRAVLGILATIALASALVVPKWLQDPWEYNFARLGSLKSKHEGAGIWSQRASEVFGGKANLAGAMMLANSPDQVEDIKRAILANDRSDPQGPLIASIVSLSDVLPGSEAIQKDKLDILDRIRSRLTPRVFANLPPETARRFRELRPPDGLGVVGASDLPRFLARRFEETNGVLGSVFYVRYKDKVSFSDGRNLLRMAKTTGSVRLPDGSQVTTANRSMVFAELIRSIRADGPKAAALALLLVLVVVFVATSTVRGTLIVAASLLWSVLVTAATMAFLGVRVNFLNFVALPITLGIGCEYPFNVFDRIRLCGGRIGEAVRLSGGPVALCSYTTIVGYGSLALSDNQALRSFGKIAAVGELVCLAGALVVVPVLVALWPGRAQTESSPLRTGA